MGSIASLRGKLIGVDTSAFIYFIEENPHYLAFVDPFFNAVNRGEIRVVTSALTLTEVLVLPLRSGDRMLVDRYTRILLHASNILTVEVSNTIAARAAELRATYNFRTPDAIQLATAMVEKADALLTNDRGFAKSSSLDIVFVDQLS